MAQNSSNYIHSGLLRAVLFAGVCFMMVGCKPSNKSDSTASPQGKLDLVQAVMKIQPFDYDPQDKTKVTGDYLDKTKVVVPNSLSGQNKWFMFEGPVLENDKVAYRYYADARHRFDIYGKKVSDLVMDTVSWNYHDIMDWGSDILKVGSSLGIGSPAILYQDSIYALENWKTKTIEVINDTDDHATIRTVFSELEVEDQVMDLQQDWTISAGGYDTSIEIKRLDGPLPESMKFVTGIVSHLPEVNMSNDANHYYSYTWGRQSYHDQNLGMAIIADSSFGPQPYANKASHITLFDKSANGVKYKFMAVWAEGVGNIDSPALFEEEIRKVLTNSK